MTINCQLHSTQSACNNWWQRNKRRKLSPNFSITWQRTQMMAPSTAQVAWYWQPILMLVSTINRKDVAEPVPIFFSKDDPEPRWNGPILTIAQIIKFVMTSASEAELGALFVTAKELVSIRQTLTEMGWKQPMTPIQTDNTTVAGVVNNTIIPKKSKSMDLRFWWLKCRKSQQQFRCYLAPGRDNWGNYSTQHHPPIYHESN